LVEAKKSNNWDNKQGFLVESPEGFDLGKADPDPGDLDEPAKPTNQLDLVISSDRSAAVPEEQALKPPFWGTKILLEDEIPFEQIFAYLDRQALFASQWQLRKNQNQSREEYDQIIQSKAEPVLKDWIERIKAEDLLSPRVAYGYFPCGRDGNSVVIYDPANPSKCLGRFELPRQRSGNRYCIADFYRDLNNQSATDVIPCKQ
jgi:5-methyltetrahydrofolate--homocysteine methyltransferase